MSNLKNQAIKSILLSYIALALGFFYTLLRVKALSIEEIGFLSIFLSLAAIIQVFIQYGGCASLIFFIPKFNGDRKKAAGTIAIIFVFSLLLFTLSIVLIFLLKSLILRIYDNDIFIQYFSFFGIILFVSNFTNLIDSALKAFYKSTKSLFINQVLKKIAHILLLVIIIIFSLDFKVFFYSYLSIEIILFIILIITSREILFNVHPDLQIFKGTFKKKFIKYNSFMLLSGTVDVINTQFDKLLIGSLIGFQKVGIYSIAVVFGNLIGAIGVALSRVLHPKVSEDLANFRIDLIKKDYKEVGSLQTYIAFFIFIYLSFFSKDILALLGTSFIEGTYVIIIIGIGQLINLMSSICGGIINYSEYYKFDIVLKMALVFINVSLNFLLISKWGINGAAIAFSFTMVLYNLIKIIFVYIKYKIHPFSKETIKLIVANIVLLATYFICSFIIIENQILYLVLIGILGFIVYNILLFGVLKYRNIYISYEKIIDSLRKNK